MSTTYSIDTAQKGDGTAGNPSLLRQLFYEAGAPSFHDHGPHAVAETDSCTTANACSAGTKEYIWHCGTSITSPGYHKGTRNKRGYYTFNLRDQSAPPGMTPSVNAVKTRMIGASTLPDVSGNTDAPLRWDYEYSYGTGGDGRAAITQEYRTSLLAPVGDPDPKTRTKTFYTDATNKFVQKIVQSGFTKVRDPATGIWATSSRQFIATFYFYSVIVNGNTLTDAMGRPVEVHGPCFVANEAATDCSGSYPITRNTYYGATATPVENRHRLQKVERFPTGLTTGLALTTQYLVYDLRGNALQIQGPDGVITYQTFAAGKLQSRNEGTNPSTLLTYAYDGEKQSSIGHPDGSYEVFCHRDGARTNGCVGNLGTRLKWKAKAGNISGSQWTEMVVYDYWTDGTTKSESYYSNPSGAAGQPGELRRVVSYAADAHQRPTLTTWGIGTGAYSAPSFYDRADNLAGIGKAFNAAPPWCGGRASQTPDLPSSQNCTQISHDGANRPITATEYTDVGGSVRLTHFKRDGHGNLVGVKNGCGAGTDYNSCTSVTPHVYQFDDFGNMVVATPAGVGELRQEFNASGNVVVREDAVQRAASSYTRFSYDFLGRVTLAEGVNPSSTEQLFAYTYDTGAQPPSSCLQVPSQSAMGRVFKKEDSFGLTWFAYDNQGNITDEIRLRNGVTSCTGTVDGYPNTRYVYLNRKLSSVYYPYGRQVAMTYGAGGNRSRVSDVSVFLWDGATWLSRTIIHDARWEPFGGLRGYRISNQAVTRTVEYMLGDNAVSGSCGISLAGNDLTGRLRALRVSLNASPYGFGYGEVFGQIYGWQADQLTSVDTCVRNGSTRIENYAYDKALRVLSMSRPSGNTAPGGPEMGATYNYSARDNGSETASNSRAYVTSFGSGAQADRLTARYLNVSGALQRQDYGYDADGRVTRKYWPNDSAGFGAAIDLRMTEGGSNGAVGRSVFKSINVNGGMYNYWYDDAGRRRAKVYPSGNRDEFFYSRDGELILDQGNNTVGTPVGSYPVDEYVWLGGKPVIVLRSKFSTAWVRQQDEVGSCDRNGALNEPCGLYFPVTDYIGKPVLMLDASFRITGTGEYAAYGRINRQHLGGNTPHPYPTNMPETALDDFTQNSPSSSLVTEARIRFDVLDTDLCFSFGTVYGDPVYVKDGSTNAVLAGPFGGSHKQNYWSNWLSSSASRFKVTFTSDAQSVWHSGRLCGTTSSRNFTGVAVGEYEYRRFEQAAGARPFWTPFRFPGQYHDHETDFYENWNRYFDPSIGRYLQPDPLLGWEPQTNTASPYTYAAGNPLLNVDPTGLYTIEHGSCMNYTAAINMAQRAAGCVEGEQRVCNDCTQKIAECKTCDVCKILNPGSPPGLRFEPSPQDPDAEGMTRKIGFGIIYVGPVWIHPKLYGQCTSSSPEAIRQLAETLLHEATHVCEAISGPDIGDVKGDPCNAESITKACFP